MTLSEESVPALHSVLAVAFVRIRYFAGLQIVELGGADAAPKCLQTARAAGALRKPARGQEVPASCWRALCGPASGGESDLRVARKRG